MALTGEKKNIPKTDGEGSKESLVVTIDNGTLEQIKELQKFLLQEKFAVTDDLTDVVRVALSFLESIKENKSKETK